jgi:cardiolipin synthase
VLLLQGRVEYFLVHHATRALYGELLAAGVEIYEYHRSFLHAKVAVIDGDWSTVGSSNIDPVSLLLAREANVVIEDGPFGTQLLESLDDAIRSDAARVTVHRWGKTGAMRRLLATVAYGLVRWLTAISAYGNKGDVR